MTGIKESEKNKNAENAEVVLLFLDASHFVMGCDFLGCIYGTVHLILDNARYQKCKAVMELAEQLGIVLNYIPPYSPNLDLIERLWRFVKGELRSKYYDDFAIFQQRIDSIIESTSNENKSKISKLIGQKVQLFDDLRPVCKNTFAVRKRQKRASVA